MYAMLGTRQDIAYAVSVVSRYAAKPTPTHKAPVTRVLRYMRKAIDYALVFKGELAVFAGYSDSDWAGDYDTRKSTSGYVSSVGSARISWSSKCKLLSHYQPAKLNISVKQTPQRKQYGYGDFSTKCNPRLLTRRELRLYTVSIKAP
jgi:hypothetical protein